MTHEPRDPRPKGQRLIAGLGKLAAIFALAYGAHLLMNKVEMRVDELGQGTKMALTFGLLAAYALLLAVPFVPGVELGVSMLVLRGAEAAPAIYLATLVGLTFAFLLGRYIPNAWLRQFFADLRLTPVARLLERVEPLDGQERLDLLCQRLPKRLGSIMVRFRYVMIALLVNLPGSTIIGGGGGILMLAGLSRLFSSWWIVLTLAVAVAPVPLAVWLIGNGFLE